MKKKITILDCTLRDGGYYNNWDFNLTLVKDYLDSMLASGIEWVEIGFRFFDKKENKGLFAYATDQMINKLKINPKLNLAVMINVGDTGLNNNEIKKNINKYFPNKNKSKVKLVRLASHLSEIDKVVLISKMLKNKNYQVAVNLMQISEIHEIQLKNFVNKLNKKYVDIFYFADSLGSLTCNHTKLIMNIIKKNWKGDIGIHAHDNQSLALENTKIAIKCGAKYVDCTVQGMGRGPGNTKTELLLPFLNNENIYKISDLIEKHFVALKKKYNWGANHYYYLSSKYKIHPTYIQRMLEGKKYESKQILMAIDYLKLMNSKTFNPDRLNFSSKFYIGNAKGKWSPKNFKKKKILIIANGNNLNKFSNKINTFIKKEKPIVIFLNTPKNNKIKKIDYIAISYPTRLFVELNMLNNKKTNVIAPFSMLSNKLKKNLRKIKKFDYGIKVVKDQLEISKNYCILPNFLVISYALCVSVAGGSNDIYLAGLDGYSGERSLKKDTDYVIDLFYKKFSKIKLTSLTPTNYRVKFN